MGGGASKRVAAGDGGGSSSSVHGLYEVCKSVDQNKTRLTNAPSTPNNHANIEASRVLNQTPEVQQVVASIVSDPNFWKAVLHNPTVQSYLQSHMESSAQPDGESSMSEESDAEDRSNFKAEFLNIWQNIKLTMLDMMSHLSGFLNSVFGFEIDSKTNANTNPFPFGVEKLLGAPLMGAVVVLIAILVLGGR